MFYSQVEPKFGDLLDRIIKSWRMIFGTTGEEGMDMLWMVGYVLLGYLAVALIAFVFILIKAYTWDGDHADFLGYSFGVLLDVSGFLSTSVSAGKWALLWPVTIVYPAIAFRK